MDDSSSSSSSSFLSSLSDGPTTTRRSNGRRVTQHQQQGAHFQLCEEILHCQEQIGHWNSRLRQLERERERFLKLVRLRMDASNTWKTLDDDERVESEIILAALESHDLPTDLQDFPLPAVFPEQVRNDRDIWLAYVRRHDFALLHQNGNNNEDDGELELPPTLRADKELILEMIPKYPQIISCMDVSLQDNVEILECLLRRSSLPDSSLSFLQYFSSNIRSCPTLMSKVLSHPSGLSSLEFVSDNLKNDKSFILHVIETATHTTSRDGECCVLRHVATNYSGLLNDDDQVVLAAVSKQGMNLQYASDRLRRDRTIVIAACRQNGSAFQYCLPGNLRTEILNDKNLVKEILQTANAKTTRMCLKSLGTEQELILQALHNNLSWYDVPDYLDEDLEFAKRAVRALPHLYMDMPCDFKSDIDLAMRVLQSEEHVGGDIVLEVTEYIPEILGDKEAMLAIAKNSVSDVLRETLQFSPLHIRSNKEIMLEAVKNDPVTFEYCTDELHHDFDILMALVTKCPAALYLVSDGMQELHPCLVVQAIQNAEPEDLWYVGEDIADHLWSDRDVVRAWLECGGKWRSDDFSEHFRQDKELFLGVAEYNYSQFHNASDALRENKRFMLQAIEKDGRVFRDAMSSLRYDFDLALEAFSGSCESIHFYLDREDNIDFMLFFANVVHFRLAELEDFKSIFVNDIMKDKVEDSTSVLYLLNQGPETTREFQMLIGSFVGIPNDTEATKLEKAARNLGQWGF